MNLPRHNSRTGPDPRVLPSPSAAEQERCNALTQLIRDAMVATGGSLDFVRFMELSLYAPRLGYYTSPNPKFGADGDFITAPEISPLFARCLARPCAQVLAQLGGGNILEAGAGSGNLAADLLLELEALEILPEFYFILELSPDLRARQADTLQQKAPQLRARVQWLDALPPPGFRGVVLGNELLDAMPVQLFHIGKSSIQSRRVAWNNGKFIWDDVAADPVLRQRLPPLSLPVGYVSEVNVEAQGWVRSIADVLHQGILLLVDYGFPQAEFYHLQRVRGTLMCHYRHHAHDDPLILTGLQDITAHIDFTAIAEAGTEAGLKLFGYTSQASFLLNCGLDEFIATSSPEDVRTHLELTQQVKKLTMPHEMGELFKVIALGRGVETPLRGFAQFDRRGRL